MTSTSTTAVSPTPAVPEDIGAKVRAAHRQYPTGVTVVTAADGGHPYGLAVNAFSSVSYEPPMILFCVNESSRSFPRIFESDHIGINILASDQMDVAGAFARSGGDKFAGVDWHLGATGSPVLDGVASYFELEVKYKIPAYTHTIFIGRVVEAGTNTSKSPLVYKGGSFFDGEQLVPMTGDSPAPGRPEGDPEESNRSVLTRMLALEGPEAGGPEGGDIYGTGYIRHTGSTDYDLETFRSGLAAMYRGFPDMHRTIKDVIVDGNRAAYRWEATGTHEGTYMGVLPTHRSVQVSGIVQCRFSGARIVEEWATWDKAALLHQLGIMPLDRD